MRTKQESAPRVLLLGKGPLRQAAVPPGEVVILDEDRGKLSERLPDLGRFDFIYSDSLLERLDPGDAQDVVATLTIGLKPGGRLLLANPAPRYEYTDGAQVYRTEFEMAQLTGKIPEHRTAGHAVFRDDSGSTVFLEVHCRTAPSSRAARA